MSTICHRCGWEGEHDCLTFPHESLRGETATTPATPMPRVLNFWADPVAIDLYHQGQALDRERRAAA